MCVFWLLQFKFVSALQLQGKNLHINLTQYAWLFKWHLEPCSIGPKPPNSTLSLSLSFFSVSVLLKDFQE